MKANNIKKLKDIGYNGIDDWLLKHCGGAEEPCYVTRVKVQACVNTVEKAHVLIEVAADESQKGMLLFSVTDRDGEATCKALRDAASEYEGATCTECLTRHHGDYKCWLICIPIF